MFKRSITADLFAPKNIQEQLDSNPLNFQHDLPHVLISIWKRYQLPIFAGAFLSIFCAVFTLDYFRTIALEELTLAIQRHQSQIQSLQTSLQGTTKISVELGNGQNDSSRDDEPVMPEIKYWGMMRVGPSTKALIEINQHQKLLKVGEEVDEVWLVKSFDQDLISLESKQGRLIKISMEMPS